MTTKKTGTSGSTRSEKTASAAKAAPKKGAAKKTAAKAKAAPKKSPAKKQAAKAKAAPKKSPAKKPAAKAKAAPKKSPAKKPAAKAKAAPKKGAATAKKAPGKKAPAAAAEPKRRPAAKKAKSPFKVNDRVVYPHHGAAIIKGKERREIDGEKMDYFVIEAITNPLTLRIPIDKATELGLRPVISRNAARKVFSVLKDDPVDADATWARWFKLLQDKMSSGDIYEVASVVRDLTYAQQSKPLGPALKRMLAKARLILTSELQLALDIDEDSSAKRLDRALAHLIVETEEVPV